MSSIRSDEIISILKEEIENYEEVCKDQEVGTVISVGDGIATIYGIDHAMYGEIVTFENGLKGMVQDVRQNSIGCILFGSDEGVREGTKVSRTQRKAGIPVGEDSWEELSMPWAHPSTEKERSRRRITGLLRMRLPESLTESLSAFRWRQEFCPSTPCSLLAGDSVS